MKEKDLSGLSDAELLGEAKKIKSTTFINAVLIGLMIGVALYSTVKNGFGFFTIFPLFFAIVAFKNGAHKKAIEQQMSDRNLK